MAVRKSHKLSQFGSIPKPPTNTKPMRKTVSLKFSLGEMVILKTEPQIKRIVTGLILRQSGKMYELVNGVESSWHQEVEIESMPEKAKPVKGFK